MLESLKNTYNAPLESYIFALGIDGVGKKTAKDLAKRFKNIENLSLATFEQILETPEVGDIIANNIVNYFKNESNRTQILELRFLGIDPQYQEQILGDVFKGAKVVLTGTLQKYKRAEAQKIIESFGGEVCGSVSKLTTMVLAGEEAGSKLDKAKALGIKIISEDEFDKMIGK